MKNKKLKFSGLVGITLLSAIMLTGCGNNDVKTYDKEQVNVDISEITNMNNDLEELNELAEENKIIDDTSSENQISNSDNNQNSNKSSIGGKVVNVQLQTGRLNYDEYAVLHAYDKDGNEIWKYKTGTYAMTELERIQLLDSEDEAEYVYIVEGGTIVKFNKQTGDIIWKNSDFGGASVTYTFDEQDNLYIAGYYGPNLCVINKDGKTIKKLEDFPSKDYCWASYMGFSDSGNLEIVYEMNPEDREDAIVEVNISDYSYKVK
ncbi:MAG: hypothetical protein J6A89_03030 [Clostridia bacterium]|nr:hypothetical protein [Clostridia bacterium]